MSASSFSIIDPRDSLMVSRAKEVGARRYRESAGRYYEEFEIGDVYEHRPGRTLTETDNIWFSLLTMNQHPLHIDNAYGAASDFGRCLINSALTLAIVTGMSVSDVSQKTVANLGWDKVRLTAPVFAGDTIYAESEVIAKRESASRPQHGIVTVRTTGKKADGTVFMTFERSALIPKRGHAVDDRLDY
jgi:acyl dehydratase